MVVHDGALELEEKENECEILKAGNSSMWEVDTGSPQVQGHLQLRKKLRPA